MSLSVPKYRVRLFLSADLAGSTAFKNSKQNPVDWVPKFKDFYSSFSDTFSAKFDAYCDKHPEMCEPYRANSPKLWKTIGDEIVFANRVTSCAQTIAYVHAFVASLETYSRKLKTDPSTSKLDVKGNAWIASFPFPNQTITIRQQDEDLISEEIELDADQNPQNFEFLGSGIDSGFRIAKHSSPSFFTISPALAYILCMPPHNHETVGKLGSFPIRFKGTDSHKGLVNGEAFPVIGIDTERDPNRSSLNKRLFDLVERKEVDQTKLKTYLSEFASFHSVSSPELKLVDSEDEIEEPDFYNKNFLPSWEKEYEKMVVDQKNIKESANSDDGSDTSDEEKEELLKDITVDD